jgi:hypothetical protein
MQLSSQGVEGVLLEFPDSTFKRQEEGRSVRSFGGPIAIAIEASSTLCVSTPLTPFSATIFYIYCIILSSKHFLGQNTDD